MSRNTKYLFPGDGSSIIAGLANRDEVVGSIISRTDIHGHQVVVSTVRARA